MRNDTKFFVSTPSSFAKLSLMKTYLATWIIMIAGCSIGSFADTRNGNDFALYFSEAKTYQEKKDLFEDARGNPHYFRYLLVMEYDDSDERAIHIIAKEPASLMNVDIVVTKLNSLAKLKEEPRTQQGNAIAITGVVKSIKENTIVCSPVIVRHKDRLTPKPGKEMFYEIDASGTFYSYTGGKRPVSLTFQDRDLLDRRGEIMGKYGKEGWAEFLEKEVAKRKAEREKKAKEYKEQQKK